MRSPQDIISHVPDFYMDGRGEEEEGMELGLHNADRIINALYEAGWVIVPEAMLNKPRSHC